jgi:hypothetical protein
MERPQLEARTSYLRHFGLICALTCLQITEVVCFGIMIGSKQAPVTVESKICEIQRSINSILTGRSVDKYMNIIGKKPTEPASVHSEFRRILSLNLRAILWEIHVICNKVMSFYGFREESSHRRRWTFSIA